MLVQSTCDLWGTSSDKMFVLVQHDEACVSEGRALQSRTQHWIASLEWEETPKIQGANFQETRRELRFCPWHPFAWEYTATATATVAGSAATPVPSLLRCNKPHISRWPGVCHRIALGPHTPHLQDDYCMDFHTHLKGLCRFHAFVLFFILSLDASMSLYVPIRTYFMHAYVLYDIVCMSRYG